MQSEKMVYEKSWNDFRDSGFLWWTNMILHTFGWAIVIEFGKNNQIINVYPARVKFRGFGEKNNTKGYIMVSEYMKDNADSLLEEAKNYEE